MTDKTDDGKVTKLRPDQEIVMPAADARAHLHASDVVVEETPTRARYTISGDLPDFARRQLAAEEAARAAQQYKPLGVTADASRARVTLEEGYDSVNPPPRPTEADMFASFRPAPESDHDLDG